jgi:hypothetical protein
MSLTFEPSRLPSQEQVSSWVKTIQEFGPRLTGSEAQRRCIDFLAVELERTGLSVMRDTRYFQRWQPETWALTVTGEVHQKLRVAYPFPYSGRTQPTGVKGQLVWFGGPPFSFRRAAGKIAVIEVQSRRLSPLLLRLFTKRIAALPAAADLLRTERTPLLSGETSRVNLKRAADAGVLGVICIWRGCAEDDVENQYLPFTIPYRNCPALWVGSAAGDLLLAACRRGDSADLVLEAHLEDQVRTETIYAVLPGADADETILINTHSDGPNLTEENGIIGVLALARYFTSLPQTSRRRTIVFVVATGHFQLPQLGNGGQATKAWLDHHPELWDGALAHRRAVAGLTLEHLGCLEWKENDLGDSYGPTGQLERELVYATNATMQDVYQAAVKGRTKLRSLVVEPRNGFFLGEGEPLFDVGIPSISLCPVPNYLCAVLKDGGVERLDQELMYQQITTFTKALLQIDGIPTDSIGPVARDWTAFIGKFVKSIFVAG